MATIAIIKLPKGTGYAEAATRIRKALGPVGIARMLNRSALHSLGDPTPPESADHDHDEWLVDGQTAVGASSEVVRLDLRPV